MSYTLTLTFESEEHAMRLACIKRNANRNYRKAVLEKAISEDHRHVVMQRFAEWNFAGDDVLYMALPADFRAKLDAESEVDKP